MTAVALVETRPTSTNYDKYFPFEFDRYALCSDSSNQKPLKRDMDIDIDANNYEWLILVGAEALKYFTRKSGVTEYNGKIVEEKYLALINPGQIKFKPEAKKAFEEGVDSINAYVSGDKKVARLGKDKCYGIRDSAQAVEFLKKAIAAPYDFITLDSETSDFDPRKGYMLGWSMSYEPDHGVYVDAECTDYEVEQLMQELFNKKTVVFHNAKFDLQWFEYQFNFSFPNFEDTMLMHYMFDETPGNHGLKTLAMKHTPYGDYEAPLEDWKAKFRKENGILMEDFSYSYIPFEIMEDYAAMDAIVTFLLYQKMAPALAKNDKLSKVYRDILLEGCNFLKQVEDNGVPFSPKRLKTAQQIMAKDIEDATAKLYEIEEVRKFEKAQGKDFNPNSTVQLRSLLYDYIGLKPTGKKTGTGAESTDAEVLKELTEQSVIPQYILDIRQKVKIKTTYLDKILTNLNGDNRLRTGFNLHSTTSGRLSSSGKLNMQQLPRDNPTVKGCIMARPGHQIVAMDLTTAEVYVAAVLAKDKGLMDVFRSGGNFHSTIAKQVFRLPCEVEEVASLYSAKRQQAKAVTFGIMYGAGPNKISWQVTKDSGETFTVSQAQDVIKSYFGAFPNLRKWLDDNQSFIKNNGFIYSQFGRKRRLADAQSSDQGIASHAIRSGINFLVQSVASDINLMGAIDMQKYINSKKMGAKIFALVHDSILAEVPDSEVDEYKEKLQYFVQHDRGVAIPGCPIGCDFEVGQDYSMGKFESYYGT